MPRRRPVLAIVLMFGASAAFVVMQAVVKHAREVGLDTTETMFFRTAPGLPLLWWSLRARGQGLWPARPKDLLVRSVLGSLAMSTNFTAMRWLSLAQFSTLGLSQPVFVALAAPRLLGERLNRHAWIAMAFAVCGALVLIAPGLKTDSLSLIPALLAVTSALFSAFAHIWVRKATEHDPPDRVVFHFAALVALGSLVLGLSRGYFTAIPQGVSGAELALIVFGLAGFGTLGQVLMTRAHVHGDAPTVAMVGYAGIGLSMLADVILFDSWPAHSAYAGACLMIAAGGILVYGAKNPASPPYAPAATRDRSSD
jgi:drug/metabolite transporter (DMT)-like permease